MATRFYMHPTTVPSVSPAFGSGWEDVDGALRRTILTDKTSFPASSGFVGSNTISWTSGQDALALQGVSEPMSSGLVFTGATFDSQWKCLEIAAQDNVVERLRVAIYSEDGNTLRSELLAIAGYGNEVELVVGTHTNNTWANGDATGATYTTVSGDRFVIELGFTDVTGTTPQAIVQYGGQTGATDLGVNETETGLNFGWLETNVNITFSGGGAPSVARRMLLGVGT